MVHVLRLSGRGRPQAKDLDIAVLPSPDGKMTSKLHADTIGIMATTAHPDEAFEVVNFLLATPR